MDHEQIDRGHHDPRSYQGRGQHVHIHRDVERLKNNYFQLQQKRSFNLQTAQVKTAAAAKRVSDFIFMQQLKIEGVEERMKRRMVCEER